MDTCKQCNDPGQSGYSGFFFLIWVLANTATV